MSFYVSTAIFVLLHCDEWDRVVALPRHKFVTGTTLLQLYGYGQIYISGGATGSDVPGSDVSHVTCPDICFAHAQQEVAPYPSLWGLLTGSDSHVTGRGPIRM